jgi:hypothetical protein
MTVSRQDRVCPSARQDGLVRERLGDELLVYDTQRDTAHCLAPVAARVWDACDGQRQLAALVAATGDSEDAVRLALHELAEKDLLKPDDVIAGEGTGVSRAHVIRRIASVGVAAGSLPLIVSAVISPAAALASASSVCATCTPTTGPDPCGSGLSCAPTGICIPDNCTPSSCSTVGAKCSLGTPTGTCDAMCGTMLCCL